MSPTYNGSSFDGIWESIRRQEFEPLSEEDGYRWGLSHLAYVKKELLKLEERALARKDLELLNNILVSKLRTVEAEEELRKKLAKSQTQ